MSGGPIDVEAQRFPSGCVASPHYLAAAAGLGVLAAGGNALDAAVATNLTLGVVTPYLCGYGGDLFAMVWADGELSCYEGCGRAPVAATLERVRAAVGADSLPPTGPLTVTVPGAPEAWFALLERFGTRSFGDLARPALALAREGFPLTGRGTESLRRSQARFHGQGFEDWQAVYGEAATSGGVLRQAALARTIEALATEGPEPYYRGAIAEAIVEHLQRLGGLMAPKDLADHRGTWVRPLSARFGPLEILEMPPPTQGTAALEALGIVEALGELPADGPARQHLLIEATKLALADRDAYLTDPDHMAGVSAEDLVSAEWAGRRARTVDARRAGAAPPGRAATGGTAYLCAADRDGMLVSLIQSNYQGFGSGVTVPAWGVNLQNRGSYFSLDPAHANVVAPRKRTLHTLIPAMALRGGRPELVFGTMGGDGQVQTHLQLLVRIVRDGFDPQAAISAPRWVVSPSDWSVTLESRSGPELAEGLRRLGHDVRETGAFDALMGHAHGIAVRPDGYAGATDPRSEGAVLGL